MGLTYSQEPTDKDVIDLLETFNLPHAYFKEPMSVTNDKMQLMISYLLKKHKNVCYYTHRRLFDIGWYIKIENENVKSLLEVDDFIVKRLIEDCKKRFAIIPLFLQLKDLDNDIFDAHQNMLLIDLKMNTVERFEPYGYTRDIVLSYEQKELDKQLTKFFHEFTFISPLNYCPQMYGFQSIDEVKLKNSQLHDMDPRGFCAFWSIFYADLRLSYPNISREKLVHYASEQFKSLKNVRAFIRNYGVFILKHGDSLSKTRK